MKCLPPLDEQTRDQLRLLMHTSPHARVRHRAHAILLSARGYHIAAIADIFADVVSAEVDRDTVARWLDNWSARGVEGLPDKARPGRPRTLTPDQENRARAIALEEPRQIKLGLARIREVFSIERSLAWLRSLLRQGRLRYKRIRASLRSKRQESAFRQAQQELALLQEQEQAGLIDLYYADEVGFALRPSLAYAWQPLGVRLEVEHTGRDQINVLGFLRRDGDFVPLTSEQAITSEAVIACFDYFAGRLRRKTVVVLDNAPVHTSRAARARLTQWQEQGLFLYYLPSYSPELNLIEHLWRKIKYLWMPFSAYESFKTLRQALDEILIGVGTKYRITFS